MDTRPTTPLDDAIEAARALPSAQQDAVAVELMDRVAQLSRARLSKNDAAEVRKRLAAPAVFASDADLKAFFARHGLADEPGTVDGDTLAAIDEALAQLARGEHADKREVEALFATFRS